MASNPTQTTNEYQAGDVVRLPEWPVGQGAVVLGVVQKKEGVCLRLRQGGLNTGPCSEGLYLAASFERMEKGSTLTMNDGCTQQMVGPRTTKWQSIETAPRDGTVIACCRKGEPGWYRLRWKFNDRVNKSYFGDPVEWDDYDLIDDQPTHWFDVPEPPV